MLLEKEKKRKKQTPKLRPKKTPVHNLSLSPSPQPSQTPSPIPGGVVSRQPKPKHLRTSGPHRPGRRSSSVGRSPSDIPPDTARGPSLPQSPPVGRPRPRHLRRSGRPPSPRLRSERCGRRTSSGTPGIGVAGSSGRPLLARGWRGEG